MKKKSFLILGISLLAFSAYAQDYYQKTFSNASYTDARQLSNGEILLVGQVAKMIPGSAIVQKISAEGTQISSDQLTAGGGSGLNFFGGFPNHTITLDGDNVLLSVYSSGFTGNTSIYPGLLKMDADGEVLWNKVYKNDALAPGGTNARGGLTSTLIDGDNYVSSGWFNSGSGGAFDYFNMLQKTDADGNVIWRKDFGYAFIFASDVKKAANGDYIVLGGQSGGLYLYIFDNDGNYISHSRYGIGTVYPVANQILNTDDGGFLIIGQAAYMNGYVLKLNASYEVEWSKQYTDGTKVEAFNKVIPAEGGGYIIAGDIKESMSANGDGLLLKIDDEGEVLWSKTYGRATDDGLYGLTATEDGYLAVGGSGTDGWVLHTDLEGNANGCDEFTGAITAAAATTTATLMAAITPMSTTGVLDEPVTKSAYASTQVLPYAIEISAEQAEVCAGGAVQLALTVEQATAVWSTDGEGALYTDAEGTVVYDGTSKVHSVYVAPTASQTYTATACLLTDTFAITVSTANAPEGEPEQQVCFTGTLAGLAVTGTDLTWYDAETEGNELAPETELEDGTTYYVSQTNICGESPRLAVTVTVNATPAPEGEAIQSSCTVETLADVVVTGENITWYDAATGGDVLAATTEVEDEAVYYASQTVNGCESQERLGVTIDACLSLPDFGTAALKVYPNPVIDRVTVESRAELEYIRILSITGQVVKMVAVSGNRAEVSMQELTPGVYFVAVGSGNGMSTVKLIKQ
ncbi:Ig-like domain-containing protein [Flavobacterium akiainvivens]|nr:T9SS type A sorting domain-containing protein [Flavobacterium akiainvivens]